MTQRSCAGEKAEETPRRLDSRRGQSGIERLVGYPMVDGKFVLQLSPSADGVHPLPGEGFDVASHHIVVGDGQGGKEQVTVLPLHIKLQTPMQRHVYAVKNCMSRIWRRGSEPCRSVVIILA